METKTSTFADGGSVKLSHLPPSVKDDSIVLPAENLHFGCDEVIE